MIPQVWAPRAASVELVGPHDEPLGPMRPDADGWWSGTQHLAAGTDYGYRLDGGPVRPDPRTAWQPEGVHGLSRVFDASAHVWRDAGWSGVDARGAVTYELHVGTFTPEGTLAAAAGRLEHLVDLGVDIVELMPVAAFDGHHGWGYDGVAPYAVHEPYGGPAALQDLVDAAHQAGLGVCLDVVYNHLGPSGNYLSEFGPYFTDRHSTPWGDAVNLDAPGSVHVRRWICDNALRWFTDFHVDALRLDAVHALQDSSPVHVLAQLSQEVGRLAGDLGRPLSLVAESDLDDVVTVEPVRSGGWGLTGQWDDDVHHAVHALVTGERQGYYVDFGTPQVLGSVLTGAFRHTGDWSTFRERPWGRPVPDEVDGHRFVVAASTHDQVGNRALGDRPSARLDGGGLAAEAALVLLSPFSPMVFMGEEWGAATPFQYFTDYSDPDLGRAVRDGRRAEFAGHGDDAVYGGAVQVPDPQDPSTFTASRLDWREPADGEHARLLDWYRQLIALRRAEPDLASGDRAATRLVHGPQAADGTGAATGADGPYGGWLVVARGDARIVVNLASEPVDIPVDAPERPVQVRAAWAPGTQVGTVDAGVLPVRVPARSVVVLA